MGKKMACDDVRDIVFYPYPGEEGHFKRILEEDDVNEAEDEARPVEPEMVIWRLNHQITCHHHVSLSYLLS